MNIKKHDPHALAEDLAVNTQLSTYLGESDAVPEEGDEKNFSYANKNKIIRSLLHMSIL